MRLSPIEVRPRLGMCRVWGMAPVRATQQTTVVGKVSPEQIACALVMPMAPKRRGVIQAVAVRIQRLETTVGIVQPLCIVISEANNRAAGKQGQYQ